MRALLRSARFVLLPGRTGRAPGDLDPRGRGADPCRHPSAPGAVPGPGALLSTGGCRLRAATTRMARLLSLDPGALDAPSPAGSLCLPGPAGVLTGQLGAAHRLPSLSVRAGSAGFHLGGGAIGIGGRCSGQRRASMPGGGGGFQPARAPTPFSARCPDLDVAQRSTSARSGGPSELAERFAWHPPAVESMAVIP